MTDHKKTKKRTALRQRVQGLGQHLICSPNHPVSHLPTNNGLPLLLWGCNVCVSVEMVEHVIGRDVLCSQEAK